MGRRSNGARCYQAGLAAFVELARFIHGRALSPRHRFCHNAALVPRLAANRP
ncbi:MAG TPA: hypothetical protein VH186_27330 [Chloroflexia bacterium]|nr:hypothetical protein [Chloroflexia bacterium]